MNSQGVDGMRDGEQDRAGDDMTGQGRVGLGRTGQDKTGSAVFGRTVQDSRTVQDRAG